MKYLVLSLVFLGILLAQKTFADFMAIYEVKPNFIVIYLIFISLKYGRVFGCLAGFFMGVFEDVLFSALFGLSAFCKSFVGYFSNNVPVGFLGTASLDTGFLIFIVTFTHNILYDLIYSLGTEVSKLYLIVRYAFPGAIYTALIGFIIYAIYPKFLSIKYEQS